MSRHRKKYCKALKDQVNALEVEEKRMEDELRKRLHDNHKIYLKRLQIGEKIATVLKKGEILEESLSKEHKDMLDLHRRQ